MTVVGGPRTTAAFGGCSSGETAMQTAMKTANLVLSVLATLGGQVWTWVTGRLPRRVDSQVGLV
jgi:hypothetical protein